MRTFVIGYNPLLTHFSTLPKRQTIVSDDGREEVIVMLTPLTAEDLILKQHFSSMQENIYDVLLQPTDLGLFKIDPFKKSVFMKDFTPCETLSRMNSISKLYPELKVLHVPYVKPYRPGDPVLNNIVDKHALRLQTDMENTDTIYAVWHNAKSIKLFSLNEPQLSDRLEPDMLKDIIIRLSCKDPHITNFTVIDGKVFENGYWQYNATIDKILGHFPELSKGLYFGNILIADNDSDELTILNIKSTPCDGWTDPEPATNEYIRRLVFGVKNPM